MKKNQKKLGNKFYFLVITFLLIGCNHNSDYSKKPMFKRIFSRRNVGFSKKYISKNSFYNGKSYSNGKPKIYPFLATGASLSVALLDFESLNSSRINDINIKSSITEISYDHKRQMTLCGVYKSDSPVPLERLRLLTVPYINFQGEAQLGQLIVLDTIAESVKRIFEKLYIMGFPINKMELMDIYDGDDDKSMAANNTSSFMCRPVTGLEGVWSLHSYGVAFDLNPVENPYVKFIKETNEVLILPPSGGEYLNRSINKPGMITSEVDIWKKYRFSWGGDWSKRTDYQHFQIDRELADLFIVMDFDESVSFYNECIKFYNRKGLFLEDLLLGKLKKHFRIENLSLAGFYKNEVYREYFETQLKELLKK